MHELEYATRQRKPFLVRSEFAVLAFAVSILSMPASFLGLAIAVHLRTAGETSASAEWRELGFALAAPIGAACLTIAALIRINRRRDVLRGKRWAVGGLAISMLAAVFLFGIIVSMHSWLD